MLIENYKNLGRERINEILMQGWKQIEFIEIVFREWARQRLRSSKRCSKARW